MKNTPEGAYLNTAEARANVRPKYLETLLSYYEEEIEGEAYFEGLARRLSDPTHRLKMNLLAQVERHAAQGVLPLIQKYGLEPRPSEDLFVTGQKQADDSPATWDEMLDGMRKTFPGFVTDFKNLEALAPECDQELLRQLTQHEVAAVAFLDAEKRGDENSAEPLWDYLRLRLPQL